MQESKLRTQSLDFAVSIINEGINESKFKTGGTVIIATGADFYDALAAAGLAGRNNDPIVLTKKATVPDQTKRVLQKLFQILFDLEKDLHS